MLLDESGNFVHKPDAMAVDMGYEGDVILVNLTSTPYLDVGPIVVQRGAMEVWEIHNDEK
jgi:hypothetical protein